MVFRFDMRVTVSLQLFNPSIDFDETWYEHHTIGGT